MKKILNVFIMALAALVSGCKQPDPVVPAPEVNITEGVATPEQLEFYVSATQADEIAFICLETTDEVKVYKAEALFAEGEVFAATEEPVPHTVSGLRPETEYTVYVAAMKDEGTAKYYSAVKELAMTTGVNPAMLQFLSASKTGFSYKIAVEENQTYFHGYLPAWSFEYQYEMAKLTEGADFDAGIFVRNLLVTGGVYGQSSQTVNWFAGQEDETTGQVAYLVPGEKYYAMLALWDEEAEMWNMEENPEIIEINMEAPGESSESVTCTLDKLEPRHVNIRMECDESKVNFFLYDLYPLDQYDYYVKEYGVEDIITILSQQGYPAGNTYTDTWSVDPGKSYMHCLYGVDYNGDVFYQNFQIDVPMPEPVLTVTMAPYERELNNYNTYNTLRVSAGFADFVDFDYESSVFYLAGGPVARTTFDAMAESAGLSGSLEDLQTNGEMMYALGQAYLGLNPIYTNEQALAQLNERDTFELIFTGLEADTEYVYMVMAQYNGEIMCRLVSAKTDPAPVDVQESEAYKAFLGSWTVTGYGTDDWSTQRTYNLTFERLTSNRSVKVYGWSSQQVGQDFPFEASFDPETGKLSISTPQSLGTVVVDDVTYEVRFVGKAYDSYNPDYLKVLPDHEGVAYVCSINGSYMTMMPQMFSYADNPYTEYMSMSYVLYDPETRSYHAIEPYDLYEFRVSKAQ
ncbi:MAG: hypothetical protein J6A91_02170 [Bacteroidales bacterium]|nr:hypothetical protein [Bacteroidales bacterium]